jgi:ubiquinone/menaquinone biosynthesis C-methylase UbiE
MANVAPDLTQLKAGMKAVWMAGDFGQIAQITAKEADQFVQRLAVPSGARVLDVACGTGNTAIPAARAGADVTGVDIATNLLEQARKRAAGEQLKIKFQEGDAEELPFPDHSFDVVITMFGAMFAPRPERVANELLRVCKPGGQIAMANWTPRGFVGGQFQLMAKTVPPPPGIPAPVLWGEEDVVRQRFSNGVAELTLTPRKLQFRYPFGPKEVVQFFRQYFGPTQTAFSRLDETGQASLAADLEAHYNAHNQATDGTTMVEGEYLEVRAGKA